MTAVEAIQLAPLLPLAGALGIGLLGRWPNLREAASLATAVALFAVVLRALGGLVDAEPVTVEWLQLMPGVSIALHTEPLSILFALIASGLWIVTTVYSIGYMRANAESNQTRFYVCFAIALCGAMGVAFAANLLTLFLFYEVLTLSTWPLVAHQGDARARAGGRTYLLVLLSTSIGLLLPAMIWTYVVAGTLDFRPGGILEGRIDGIAATTLLMLYLFGVGKAALMPVHRWLPAAMVAPTPVSALLHAVAVVKAGVFTLTKVVIYVFGTDFLATVPYETLAVYAAGFTVIAASAIALRQNNLKRLLAYSTISQLGYVVLATMVLTPYSQIGAALHIVAHAFGKITLFFAAGAIYVTARKTEIPQLSGIGRRMPLTMIAFSIGALSMIGIPPTAGFVSKWFIIAGALQQHSYFVLAVVVVSTALNAAYFLPIVHRAFARAEDSAPATDHGETNRPMAAALCTTALLTLLLFFFNEPVLELEYGLVGGRP
ncbi:MAG TPA: monovalent cation/H+ antiporter subunit D family protein [Xanthomonadaceae bacterium]|nr:monovalent cation/H+ antiporter subunit D family protein [Xanthomonadaceae bacterium]